MKKKIDNPEWTCFREYSDYYDTLNCEKDYKLEAAYVSEILDLYSPEGTHLLDLGCGTGIYLSHLVEGRWWADGLDMSMNMLDVAKKRQAKLPPGVSDRISFLHGDVRSFSLNKKYDAITSLFHVLSYQISNSDILSMFECVADHLNPGGVFLFDYWYGPAVLTIKPTVRIRRGISNDVHMVRIAEPSLDSITSTVDVAYEIHLRDNRHCSTDVIRETHRMRYMFLNEIEFMLGRAGLALQSTAAWLTGEEPGLDTWSVYSVARK